MQAYNNCIIKDIKSLSGAMMNCLAEFMLWVTEFLCAELALRGQWSLSNNRMVVLNGTSPY